MAEARIPVATTGDVQTLGGQIAPLVQSELDDMAATLRALGATVAEGQVSVPKLKAALATLPTVTLGLLFTARYDVRHVVIDSTDSPSAVVAYALYGRTWITSVEMRGVTSIGSYAFYGCTGLTSVTIPSGLTSIGSDAFRSCIGLRSVTIPSGVTSIEAGAFVYCTGLESVTIPLGMTSIAQNVFNGCISLKFVTLPSGVTRIDAYAFSGAFAVGARIYHDDAWATILSRFGTNINYLAYDRIRTNCIIRSDEGAATTPRFVWHQYIDGAWTEIPAPDGEEA